MLAAEKSTPAGPTGESHGLEHKKPRSRGNPWPPGVSGNPSGISRRREELYAQIVADLGGSITNIERILVDQVVELLSRSRRTKDVQLAIRCTNSAARLLQNIQRNRRDRKPEGVSLGDILRGGSKP